MNSSRAKSKDKSGQKVRIGSRLLAAAEYVAAKSADMESVICADIGCDHGYLSIYLIEKNICDRVFACDINEKPVNIATENIKRRDTRGKNLCEKISVVRCDGLDTLENKGINNVVICGMGGEVISGILERARDFHKAGISFILQPMSSELELRVWLCENGFFIKSEKLVRDSGRIYAVMCAEYTGEKYEYLPSELILGKHNIENGGELLSELCTRKLSHARNVLKSGKCTEFDIALEKELTLLSEKLSKQTQE